jgi:hypothetical protein
MCICHQYAGGCSVLIKIVHEVFRRGLIRFMFIEIIGSGSARCHAIQNVLSPISFRNPKDKTSRPIILPVVLYGC